VSPLPNAGVGRLALPCPLRRCGAASRCLPGVTAGKATSRGVGRASEYCLRRSTGVVGFSGPALASSFPSRLRGLPTAAVPRNFYAAGSSSRALCLPFRVSRAAPACRAPGVRQPSVGSHCPIATTACGVHCMKGRFRNLACRGHPTPASFRPRRFSRPRRLPPPPALRVYFTPQPRTGFALQGLPLTNRRTSSSLAVALLSFTNTPCRWVL
jgi:hypothetical protein